MDEHTPIVSEALQLFLDKKILQRVGFAEREDLVRMTASAPPASLAGESVGEGEAPPAVAAGPVGDGNGIVTTETELHVFDYVRTRLSFLVRDEELFKRIGEVRWVDRKTTFTVFYKQERKGRLFNFREGTDPRYRFEFPDTETTLGTDNLQEIDEPLLTVFRRRVEELP